MRADYETSRPGGFSFISIIVDNNSLAFAFCFFCFCFFYGWWVLTGWFTYLGGVDDDVAGSGDDKEEVGEVDQPRLVQRDWRGGKGLHYNCEHHWTWSPSWSRSMVIIGHGYL